MEKTALIIGGSGGIGIETAKELAKKNIGVCITCRTNLEKTKEKLHEYGIKNYELCKIDVRNEKEVQHQIQNLVKKNLTIDYVIYSVSMPIYNKKIQDMEWEDFQNHIDTQIKGLFTIIKSLSNLVNDGRKIKFIAVITEYCFGKPPVMLSHYITAKYGLMGLMKCMATELSKKGWTFNMVSPGMVNTELLSHLPQKLIEFTAQQNPLKRIAEPHDVAKVISFLVSKEADYLNGVNILINGGNVIQ